MKNVTSLVASQLVFDRAKPEHNQDHPRALLVVPSLVSTSEMCAAVMLDLTRQHPALGIRRAASGSHLTVERGSTSPLLEVRHVRDDLVGNRLDVVFVWVEVRGLKEDPSLLDPWWRQVVMGRLVAGYRVVRFGDSWGVLKERACWP